MVAPRSIAARAGLSADDISGSVPARLHRHDQVVVRAVDDLTAHTTVTQPTWEELGQIFTDKQLLDLVFAIGGYYLLAMAATTFGVQAEHE